MIWALPLLPAFAGLAIWAAGDGGRTRAGLPAALVLSATLALALAAGGARGVHAWSEALPLRASLVPLSHAFAVTIPAVALAVVIFAAGHEARRGLARLLGLLLIFVGGMELVVIAGDLLTLLIGWEIVGACSWALIAHRWREAGPGASANYAFVMTRAGDLGLFLALFATWAGAGSLDYGALSGLTGWPLWIAAFGILVAAAAKAGQVPFAPWLFRAMDGPTSVSALLHSAAMVAAGAYLVARLEPELSGAAAFGDALIAVGLVTALAGGVVALREVHAKKVLAGSTSAQLGLMFAAVGAGYPGVAMLHLIVHAAFKAPLFFAAGLAHDATGSFDLREMRLGRALPWAAALTAVAALALAGVPPLSGAWSKEEIVTALGHAGPGLAMAAMVAGGLSAAYAARFALMAFGFGDRDEAEAPRGAEIGALAGLVLATIGLSALWLAPVHEAAAGLLGAELPSGTALEMAASLILVALGLLVGLHLARRPTEAPRRAWLGLAGLIEGAVTRPFVRFAAAAARFDDAILDAVPRGVAALAHAVGHWTGRTAEGALDGLAPGAADRALATGIRGWHGALAFVVEGSAGFAGWVARRGETAIDGLAPGAADRAANTGARIRPGILALIVEASAGIAGWAARTGEAVSDLVATGTGRLAGMAGHDLRRLQTGQSHHYYTLLAVGFAAALAILILGA